MFGDFDNEFGPLGFDVNPGRQTHAGFGYDPESYISTAQLVPSPYTTQPLIQSRLGGLIRLIEACDDSSPPIGDLTGDALLVYQNVLQSVTTEINGYLSSIYPCPIAQTGTVAIIQVTGVSTDGLGTVTAINVIEPGNYLTAPVSPNFPVYLEYIDPMANAHCWGNNWQQCNQFLQTGKGLELTVTYKNVNYSDESGQVLQAQTISGTPVITNGGTGYNAVCSGDILVLIGGSSFVPAKIRQAMQDLCCYEFYKRRLAPDEKNPFSTVAKTWRQLFHDIGEGEKQLDGTYKRFFSSGFVWGQKSVLFGANSL